MPERRRAPFGALLRLGLLHGGGYRVYLLRRELDERAVGRIESGSHATPVISYAVRYHRRTCPLEIPW